MVTEPPYVLSRRPMEAAMRDSEIDWSGCPDVERVPGRVSGRWVVKDSRILADGIIENFDAGASRRRSARRSMTGWAPSVPAGSSNTR